MMEPSDLPARLRSELVAAADDVEAPVGMLAAAQLRARRRSRKRTVLAAAFAATVLLGAAAIGIMRWSDGSTTEVVTGPPETGPEASPPEPEVALVPPEVEPLTELADPVALKVLAVRPNNPGFTVVDLDEGTLSRYPAASHLLPGGALDGVVITPRGDAVTWHASGHLFLVPDADFSQPPVQLIAAHVRYVPDYAPEIQVVPSPDGSHVWVVQPAIVPEAPTTLVDLIDVETGKSVSDAEVAIDFWPVGATEDALIGNTEELVETGAGWVADPDSQAVVSLDADGRTDELASGTAIAVHGNIVATLDASSTDLSLIDTAAEDRRISVEMPTLDRWLEVGGPSIPTSSPPLPTVSGDGDLLLGTGRGSEEDLVSTLYSVSMVDGATRRLAEFDAFLPLATWSRDGESVVLADSSGPPDYHPQVALVDPAEPDAEPTVVVELGPDEFILAAG